MNYDLMALFTLPTRIHFGYNSIKVTSQETKRLGIKKALVVVDEGIRLAEVDAGSCRRAAAAVGRSHFSYEVPR